MIRRPWFVVLAVLFVGCTSSSTEPGVASPPSSDASSTVSEAANSASSSTTADEPAESGDETEPSAAVEPLRPYDDDAPPTTASQVDDSVYITRALMSDSSIEMKWSTHDDAVEYHLHRIPQEAEQVPENEAMTAANMVHVADDAGRFADADVEAGVRYWYGLRALDADGVAVAHGWHRVVAITDTEPPSPVGALTADVDDGEVLLTWTRPDENYELHSYLILRGVDGEDLAGVSRTWDLDQTSFVDDSSPGPGRVTYAVVAVDFHWNDSAPAQIEVELG